MNRHTFLFFICLACISCSSTKTVDVLVIGGGASGTTAGIQSARSGVQTLIIEETPWLGGMLTSAGVSATDGNYKLPGGLWGEFRDSLANHYGGLNTLKTGWVSNVLFEPSVGNRIFHHIAANEQNLSIWHSHQFISARQDKSHQWMVKVKGPNGKAKTIHANILIDATELGDIAKACGIGYDIGMESKHETGEEIAPDSANHIIQDITYVATLKDYGKDVNMLMPEGYDPSLYFCCCTNEHCENPKEPGRMWPREKMITYGKLPNGKYMINWPVYGNDIYLDIIEMNPSERNEALKVAKKRTLGFVYFMQHELGFTHLGLADDEYPTDDLLPFFPYHRESRRIHGLVRFTSSHMLKPYDQELPLYRTNIAVGDYPVDHHHSMYSGWEKLPNLYFKPVPSYGLPLGTLIPRDKSHFIVAEKSISVSNIANGATRLQPVVLQIGQAAGVIAALACKGNKDVKEVAVRQVQDELLQTKGYLMPYLDVPVEDVRFQCYQRIGATGILKGEGRHVGWANETWFRADTLLLADELTGFFEYYPETKIQFHRQGKEKITVRDLLTLIQQVFEKQQLTDFEASLSKIEKTYQTDSLRDLQRPLKRGEAAVLIDQLLDPFHKRAVDIEGHLQ